MVQQESSAVDRLYSDFIQIISQIDASDISLRISAEEMFQKSLYIAIGSHFERRITEYILDFVGKSSRNSVLVTEFVGKLMSRQYHNFFAWGDAKNANRFFSMFGGDFKNHMAEYVRNNPEYDEAIRAFLEVGDVRNQVAHDFGTVSLEKTADEIYARYKEALAFVEQILLRFEEFEKSRQTS